MNKLLIALIATLSFSTAQAEITPEQQQRVNTIYENLITSIDHVKIGQYTSKNYQLVPVILDDANIYPRITGSNKTKSIYIPITVLRQNYTDDELAGLIALTMAHSMTTDNYKAKQTLADLQTSEIEKGKLFEQFHIESDLVATKLLMHTKYKADGLASALSVVMQLNDIAESQNELINKRIASIQKTAKP